MTDYIIISNTIVYFVNKIQQCQPLSRHVIPTQRWLVTSYWNLKSYSENNLNTKNNLKQ